MTCTGFSYPNNWVLYYSSAVLRDSGFQLFSQLLDDKRYQERKTSELLLSGLLGADGLTIMRKIRYVIDLGPSADSDLHAEHLEALTLPKGIIQYSMMPLTKKNSCPSVSVAGGHDDACRCFTKRLRGCQCYWPGCRTNSKHEAPKTQPLIVSGNQLTSENSEHTTDAAVESDQDAQSASKEGQTAAASDLTHNSAEVAKDTGPAAPEATHAPEDSTDQKENFLTGSIWDLPLPPEFRIDDYCEIRHIANVIRLLLAMAGRPLLLNSAARVYTIAGLAKLFRLASSDICHIDTAQVHSHSSAFVDRLRSIFSDWFFAPNNTNIVDILPEESFMIAWNIKLPVVARAAYRILVAERALHEAGATGAQPRTYQSRRKTIFGRELSGLLDEDMETMLDHASESFTQRVLHLRESQLSRIATLDDSNMLRYPSLNYLANIKGQCITLQQLLETDRILEDFAARERGLMSGNARWINNVWPVTKFPVADALASLRQLLDSMEKAAGGILPRSLIENEVNLKSHLESIQQSLSSYVRSKTLQIDWYANVYKKLPLDKRCMTSVYWRQVPFHIEKELWDLGLAFGRLQLVEWVNHNLCAAVFFDFSGGTCEQRHKFRTDLIERLNLIGFDFDHLTLKSSHGVDLFTADVIAQSLSDAAKGMYEALYDMDGFYPEFELFMFKPSPHLLLGLSADEFRFLPLWAGGCNDGTGAVYERDLPTAHLGPIAPGPEYHTGTTNSSMSTPSFDGAFSSMNGPPSVSDGDSGSTSCFTELAMSDAGTERVGGDSNDNGDQRSVSSSFVLVRDLNGLDIAASERSGGDSSIVALTATTYSESGLAPSNASRVVNDGHSATTGASGVSFATPSSSSTESSSSRYIVVDSAAGSAAGSQYPASSLSFPPLAATALETNTLLNDVGRNVVYDKNDDDIYDFEDEGDDDDDNDDDNKQEFYDDDDDDDDDADARSDDTVMPDRDEAEQEMRQ
ncbi:MAG: hypothetical protein STHCBS139747_005377 [Sporothrix thermara]